MSSIRVAQVVTNQAALPPSSAATPWFVGSTWQHRYMPLAPIAALYLVLGFYRIDGQSLWIDEVISVRRVAAEGPYSALLHSQSPLYFMILRLWSSALGMSEFALRSLSVFFGLASIAFLYSLAQRLLDRRAAVIAALLLATSPYFIWYAQEVRYIALMVALGLAATFLFHRALSMDGWRWWVAYGAASTVAIFTFLAMVVLFVAHGVFVLISAPYRRHLGRWLACQTAVFVLFAAWFGFGWGHRVAGAIAEKPVVVSQEQPRSRSILPASDVIGAIPYTLFAFSAGFSLGPSVRELQESRSLASLWNHATVLAPAAIIFAAVVVLGVGRLRRDKSAATLLFLWLGVPIVLVYLAGTLTSYHVYNTRYAAMALPAYILILAAGIGGLRRTGLQACVLAAVLSVHGMSLANYYFEPRYAREDTRSAAMFLETAVRPGDLILTVGLTVGLEYYYRGSAPLLPVDGRDEDGVIAERLRKLTSAHGRIWLVQVRPWYSDPQGKVQSLLDTVGGRGVHRTFAGVQVSSYSMLER